jgi:hypothetical protein
MAAKETSCGPSVVAMIWPVSPLGRNSFDTALYSKAVESTRQNPIFVDEKAREILDQIDYDSFPGCCF